MRGQFMWRLISTLALCGCFFSLGSISAIPGPTLIHLACLVGATVKTISFIYPCRSLGYLIGSATGGILIDYLARKEKLVIASSLLAAAIGIGVAPWVSSLPVLCIVFSVVSLALGVLSTGGNVFCLRLWGSKGGPYIQALHFSFGLGSFLAPLAAASFLSSNNLDCILTATHHRAQQSHLITPMQRRTEETGKRRNPTSTTTDISGAYTSTYELLTEVNYFNNTDVPHEYYQTNGTNSNPLQSNSTLFSSLHLDTVTTSYKEVAPFQRNSTNSSKQSLEFNGRQVKYCYLTIAITAALLSLLLSFLGFKSDTIDMRTAAESNLQDNLDLSLTIPTLAFKIKMIACACIFFFLHVGLESVYGQFLSLYSVSAHDFTEKQGALLTSVFWGMLTVMRALAIPLSRITTPCKLITASITITCVSSLALTINEITIVNDASLWVFSGCIGIGAASVFPTGILWLENYMLLTGRIASVFIVFSSLGKMAIPASFGFLFEHNGPTTLMFIVLGCSTGCVLTFSAMFLLAVQSPACITSQNTTSEESNSIGLSSDKERNT